MKKTTKKQAQQAATAPWMVTRFPVDLRRLFVADCVKRNVPVYVRLEEVVREAMKETK